MCADSTDGARPAYGQTALRLLALTALPVALIAGRIAYTGEWFYAHLVWNLFLAWLPLAFAALALRPGAWLRPFRPALCGLWLLFLPNAPYLITDFQHLSWSARIPILYDVALLFSAALVGLAVGLVSVRWLQAAVASRVGEWPGRAFGALALLAAGFGVYIGRYLRWNSWDLFARPVTLTRDVWGHLMPPGQNWQVWAFAALFTALLLFAYGLLGSLPAQNAREC